MPSWSVKFPPLLVSSQLLMVKMMLNPGCFVRLWLDHVKSHCLLFHSHCYLKTKIFDDWNPIVDDQNNFLKVQSQSLRLKPQFKIVEL